MTDPRGKATLRTTAGDAIEGGPADAAVVTRRDFMSAALATAAGAAVGAGAAGSAEAAPGSAPVYRIHPAIGIARLGNLDPDDGFIIGPEIPGDGPTDGLTDQDVAQFKIDGMIKPQAVRFRVFEYQWVGGVLTPVREVTQDTPGVRSITWTVHVANRKASFYIEDGPLGEALPAGDLRNPSVTNRDALESDFGPRSISGASAIPQQFTPATGGGYPVKMVLGPGGTSVIDYLGQLRTDGAGRLLVFAGKGHSASSISPPQPLTHWSNNNFWFDDIADGPVTATVTLTDGSEHPMDVAGTAWVLAAPPDFSPGLNAPVSLYDVLYDMAVRMLPIPANALYATGGPLARLKQLNAAWSVWKDNPAAIQADYQAEIWPIVINAVNLVYTTALVNFKHGYMLTDPLGEISADGDKARKVFFGYIRAPESAATPTNGPATMPRLYGDNWFVGNELFVYTFGQNGQGNAGGGAVQGQGPRSVPKYVRYSTLTPTQYALLNSWSTGSFIPPSGTPPPQGISPHGLDRAALEKCIGGPFYPGIEAGWQIRNPQLFIEPFRLNPGATSQYLLPDGTIEGTPIRPGHFSRQMALPWQADFNDCWQLNNLAWWPSARPDDVFLNAGDKLNQRVPWARPDTKWPSGSTKSGYDDMVANWYKFGFVLEDVPGVYIEMERNLQVP
jgi:hypothetical protein